ncbi:MAG: hypothetical protein ACFFBI_13120 [Promethearchaeota archaeon]
MKEEFDSTKKVIEELKGYNRKLEDDLKSSLEKVKDLELRLEDAKIKITEFETYKMQTTAKEKDFELMKVDLISKQKELESMKSELAEFMNIREDYEQKMKANEDKISELQTRNQNLEAQMLQAINISKLLKEVREILTHKGFISEMEFENIMRQL